MCVCALTGIPYDLLPGLIGEDVEQQWGDERREGPQPDGAVSAAAGHGKRTTLMARQACRDTHTHNRNLRLIYISTRKF